MNHDLFLYDTERLKTIASDDTVKQGLAYFAEKRVFALDVQGDVLTAQVEDADFNAPYWVELTQRGENDLAVACDCAEPGVCKHAIAALYSYAEQFGFADEELLGGAVDEAILERVKKGRNEVNVKLLSGNPGFGIWQATSIISATYTKKSYQVHIRSLDQRMNYCTCPDLATNRLGTCKHIEAVLHQARKRPDYQQLKAAGSPVSFVYLAWESATRPVLRLYKKPQVEADLAVLLAEYFSVDGVFNGRVPEDFFRFSAQVLGREDFLLGDDATQYVHQCAEDAAQAIRAHQISQEILRAHGVLTGIKARLFPYQTEGVAFLASRGRALLADDMGLGKTLQAIAAASWLTDNAGVRKILVVCPASLKHQWAREIEKFTGHPVQIVQGAADGRTVQYRADALFFIVNYELTVRDLSVINETLKPDLVILDEAQRIKNWRTKLASTVKLIPSRYVFVLSGTPLENRLEDLYSLLQVVDARVLGPLWLCLLEFHVTDERGKVIGYRNLSELRRRIAPVMLRRNRSLVNDQLPERTEVRLDIPLDDKQKGLHDSALSAAGNLAQIAKRRPLTPGEQNRLMSALQQARMACDAAGLVDKTTQGSPKLDELARLLEDLCLQSDRKAVIFSQWALMTEMVETLVKGMGLGCVRLHGGVPSARRGELMDKFLNDVAVQVFISTDAGATGLNLQAATVLINLDMPWNPALLDQRIARIHRLGQKQNVQIFLLLAEDSYEQHVARLVQGKRDLFVNVVSPEASEDVVGVPQKLLQTLIDDLAGGEAAAVTSEQAPAEAADAPAPETCAERATEKPYQAEPQDDGKTRRIIEKIQAAFQTRLVRVLASGGGLLAVVNQAHDSDEEAAQALSEPDIPVAVVDSRTLSGLQRLGAQSPVAESRLVYESAANDQPTANPLLKSAEAKLRSAEILLEQQATAGVMDLLASSMLATAAALAGLDQAPSAESAALWLYGEVMPKQLLTQEQATAIVRALALSQNQGVPVNLIEQSLAEARLLYSASGYKSAG
ncbi:SNF2-related protein [Methylomicrobium sp. Wu6]|uniref:DEAD/DEAH box helicase n=1 Tax=Methylomicrobium sp. Wu6 TaxID=3107928 RepID=UPI002DD65556|nr:SNF2-related protein [Methylomicrobium sp. Wu6]MEC4748769.1 SNF2-related protein [Methylomicrobium sp. Wu6]